MKIHEVPHGINVVIETDKFGDWRRFGRDAIGMHLDEALSDVMLAHSQLSVPAHRAGPQWWR